LLDQRAVADTLLEHVPGGPQPPGQVPQRGRRTGQVEHVTRDPQAARQLIIHAAQRNARPSARRHELAPGDVRADGRAADADRTWQQHRPPTVVIHGAEWSPRDHPATSICGDARASLASASRACAVVRDTSASTVSFWAACSATGAACLTRNTCPSAAIMSVPCLSLLR
jgi:hypothetical protein